MVVITLYLSARAEVNAGLITSIWSVTPFCFSVAERLLYKTELKVYHFIGILLIMICSVLLSLTSVIYPAPLGAKSETAVLSLHQKLPPYVPVIFGILTPVVFTTYGMT